MANDIDPQGTNDEVYDILKWNHDGLVSVIAQEQSTGEILMVAYANREALSQTLKTGTATYFSRSRQELWVKGETSGFKQQIREVRVDCDGDALLYIVEAPGPACHQMRRSCFSHRIDADGSVHTDKPVME
jgi:phosphoribosyl-AMP cyclohydrolase